MIADTTISQSTKTAPELSWQTVDHMDWQLWMLAVLLIATLGGGVLIFMFPSAFWAPEQLPMRAPERAFFGFSVLLGLSLIYLFQKHAKVRQLKRQLFQAQESLAQLERNTAIQMFETLPSVTQFRDTLAMEYRRASTSEMNLSVVLFTAPNTTLEKLGQITRLLRSMLRQGESLYRISNNGFGVILPGMPLSHAAAFAAQVEPLCSMPKQEMVVRITAYPEDVSSLTELEGKLRRSNEGL